MSAENFSNYYNNKIIWSDGINWYRKCPKCNFDCKFTGKYAKCEVVRSVKKKKLCNSCVASLRILSEETKRKIGNASRGHVVSDEIKKKISDSNKGKVGWNKGKKLKPLSLEVRLKISQSNKGRSCWCKGLHISDKIKKKISDAKKGKPLSKEHRLKISKSNTRPMLGKHHTDETREKMRIITLNRISKLGGGPMFNPKACQFIDNLNKEKGWNLQHALNGGEAQIYGYKVDGYDKEKNVIFEYDEPTHYRITGELREKDIRRQNDIIKYFKNKNVTISFWRYDERYKNLYEVYSQ